MNIKITSLHFKTDKKLETFIENKINKLEDLYNGLMGAEVSLKVENTTDSENKVADIRLLIPGHDLFAKKQTKSFEESVDKGVEALRRQLKKYKEKQKGE